MWNNSGYQSFGAPKQEPMSGGFLNATSNSPASQEKKRPERLTNVVACTIAQILRVPLTDEYLKIGTMTARMVTFVGLVKSMEVQSTKVTYVINDCSGPSIEVQVWAGESEGLQDKFRLIQENTYVKVSGAMRSMKDKRHVIAFKVTPITSTNEITLHILETVHMSMAIALMEKQEAARMTGGGMFSATSNVEMSSVGNYQGAMNQDFATRGLSKPQQIVLQAISASMDDQGVSIYDLFNNIKAVNKTAIKEAVDFLSNEGHIYSTIDEDHYKSTESG